MKLQIEGQHLRIRVDERELARLLAGKTIEASTQFAAAFAISFLLRLTPDGDATFEGRADAWQVSLPAAAVREHATRLPTREGLRYSLPAQESRNPLQLLFDVDVRDSVSRRRSS